MRRLPRLELSATQLLATALAAITATVAASFLGVAGTVIGAALASVVSAVGTAVYAKSLRSTHERVREVVPVRRREPAPPPVADPPRPDQVFLGNGRSSAARVPISEENVIGSRPRWRAIAFGTVAMFTVLLATVTGVEIVTGRPISDLVRGSAGSGTTLFGTQAARPSSPQPTVTQTVTPSVVVVTPTVTQTAPTVTRTAAPTVTETPVPPSDSATPSTTPSTTPTASDQPSG